VTRAARRLVSLKVSPWTERAKWALDHHGLAYEVVEHFPIIGERRLRGLVGPDKPQATVPVLIAGDDVLSESWDIAVYADRVGKGTKLIPPEHEAVIRTWTTLADEAMQSGRALVVAALLANPSALDESGPPFVAAWLRPLLRPIARRATRAFARKYGMRLEENDANTLLMRAALNVLRQGRRPGSLFLLGSFTYADIAMATMLQGISPVEDRFINLGPATRIAWTRQDLAGEYGDLIAWRNDLYERRRQESGTAADASHP
jgi:glutathione S-transferase